MSGFLLISPTGSGKSWLCKHDSFFIDGDTLINWEKIDWRNTDWKNKDKKHLNVILNKMYGSQKCICWYVGTTAIEDAIDDGRLLKNEVGVVLLSEIDHRKLVENRNKANHGWEKALEHRKLCEKLIQNYKLPCFNSFEEAVEYLKNR